VSTQLSYSPLSSELVVRVRILDDLSTRDKIVLVQSLLLSLGIGEEYKHMMTSTFFDALNEKWNER